MKHWTLFLGVLQVTVGCLVGLVPPGAVPWFRGIVMAHLAFTANGVLMIAMGFLLTEMRLGPRALVVWFAALQIGTWTNGAAGVAAAMLGATSKFLPTASGAFPPPNGGEHALVSSLLQLCGVAVLVALGLTLYGLFRGRSGGGNPSPASTR